MSSTLPPPASRKQQVRAARADATNRRAELAAERAAAAKKARQRMITWIALGVVGAVLVAFVGVWGIMEAQKKQGVTTKPAGAGEDYVQLYPGKAKAGAPVVTLYSDFQCPACKQVEDVFGAEFDRLAKNGDIDFRVRPLTFIEENFPGNQWSTKAAQAFMCAGVDGVDKAPEVFASIYTFQPKREGDGFSEDILKTQVPAAAGITGKALETYQACYANNDTKGFVKAVDAKGRELIPRTNRGWGTPTYEVKGKKLDLAGTQDPTSPNGYNVGKLLEIIQAANA